MLSPESRLLLLDHIFLRFDELVKQAGALKIETVGEVYLVAANVAGWPVPDHALVLSRLALQFVASVREMEAAFRASADVGGSSDSALRLEARVGINSGPVIGGVIGKLLPRYRIFGDTVNTAARMETSSEPGRVHLSASAAEILRGSLPPDLGLTPRGEISVKGKVSSHDLYLFIRVSKAARDLSVGCVQHYISVRRAHRRPVALFNACTAAPKLAPSLTFIACHSFALQGLMATFYLEDLSLHASAGLPVARLGESVPPHVSPLEALVGSSSGNDTLSPTTLSAPARRRFTLCPEDEAHRSALRLATVADLMVKPRYVDESLSEVDLALKGGPGGPPQYPVGSSRGRQPPQGGVGERPGARPQRNKIWHSEPPDAGLGPGASSPGDSAVSGARTTKQIAQDLTRIIRGAGLPGSTTPRELIDNPTVLAGKTLLVKVGLRQETAEFPESNEVKGVVLEG